jgi:hypothetical protein
LGAVHSRDEIACKGSQAHRVYFCKEVEKFPVEERRKPLGSFVAASFQSHSVWKASYSIPKTSHIKLEGSSSRT